MTHITTVDVRKAQIRKCAKYCSSKYQVKDWKNVHRASCHHILWLRHAIFYFVQMEASNEDVTFHCVEMEASKNSDEASKNSDEGLAFYFVELEDSKNCDEDESSKTYKKLNDFIQTKYTS